MIKTTPDTTYTFHIMLEYNFEHGLRFNFIEEDGTVVATKQSLRDLLLCVSSRVNNVIFSSLNAF